jgi:signal transduction histidine kinase
MRKGSMRDHGEPQAKKVGPPSDPAPVDREMSSARKRIPDVVPVRWLDQMLLAALELPLFAGELAVVEATVDAVSAILEGCAVGICFVPEPESESPDQCVVRRLPVGAIEVPLGVDPTRLFPGMAREYVAAIPGTTSGSTMHVASNEEDLDDPDCPAAHLAERAAAMLGRSLAHARAIASLQREAPQSHALDPRMLQADKLANFGQIAAGIVHELNNPLTSIVAYSDYLLRKAIAVGRGATAFETVGGAGDEHDLERLRRISESATRMLHFTRDLVSYARPSSGVAGPVVLHGAVDQAIAFCEHVLSAAGMRVERRYDAEVLAVHAVSEQIVQVFVNLLTNAAQAASARGGCVVVTTARGEVQGVPCAAIWVEDNGSGIAAEHLPRVFVPFFTTKGDKHGTGLGLSIVKSILENHGGTIRVESELGRGTRFAIELPIWTRG